MKRSLSGPTRRVTFRCPVELLDDVDDEAEEQSYMSRSEFIRAQLYDAVEEEG